MKRNKTGARYSIRPFWDNRTMDKQTKESRIMMIINLNGKQFRIALNMRSSKQEYDKALMSTSQRNLSDEVKQLREAWNEYALKAELILTRLSNPTQETFIKFFKSETDLYMSAKKNPIVPYFKMKEERLFMENKFSSSSLYRLALSSLLKFNQVKHHNSIMNFEDIDAKFLNGYVAWMQSLGNSIATPSMYLRNLRSIYNDSIKDGVIAETCYPFKHFKFNSNIKSKEVLYPPQLKQLLNYETTNKRKQKAIAYFFFCYTCNGMNFQDAAMLQYKNIQGDVMTFIRQKTKRTGKEIRVHMHDLTKAIIEKWGNPDTNPDSYIFGLVKPGLTPYQIQQKLMWHKGYTNESLSRIGKELGFDVHLCLNLARHSFATTLKINNTSVAAISDAMGHSNVSTTEHYMKSLPSENLKIMSNSLLAF